MAADQSAAIVDGVIQKLLAVQDKPSQTEVTDVTAEEIMLLCRKIRTVRTTFPACCLPSFPYKSFSYWLTCLLIDTTISGFLRAAAFARDSCACQHLWGHPWSIFRFVTFVWDRWLSRWVHELFVFGRLRWSCHAKHWDDLFIVCLQNQISKQCFSITR